MNELGPFLTLLVIGAAVGLAMARYGHNWLSRKVAGVTGASDATYVLVGIAGAFMGFHFGLIAGLAPLAQYILAVVIAAATVWLWRGR
jgi:hypothetical protein